ncbi:MAG: hypothetical protein ABI323_01790 [Solirubrobacteraceae bacterium]
MMSTLPLLVCAAMLLMMFGAGAIVWLATRTPLGRLSWFARRAQRHQTHAQNPSERSR